jgi:tetratricopeptide (TPR) repeat protein
MVKKLITVVSVLALLLAFGCASGGNKESGAATEAGKGTRQDERGFEKEAPTPAEISYQSAEQFLAGGNYDEAISHLRTATSLKPNYLEAWTELGRVLAKVKDFAGSIAAYGKALELAPNNTELIASIAYDYLYLENWDKAEEYYTKLVEKDSLSYDGNVHLGFIYQKKNDIDNAIAAYEKALAAQPNDATTCGTLAGLYEKKGDEAKRIEYLKKAVAAAPDNFRFKTQLGSAYMKDKDYVDALPIFEDLVKNYPDEAAYHQNLGLILSQIPDRKAEAPAELEKALSLKGDDPYICGILALVYNELGQYQNAIAAVKRGLDTKQGQEALLYYQWGVALSKLEQFDDATAMFERVVQTKDLQWTDAARKQIDRQAALKKRALAKKQQQQEE